MQIAPAAVPAATTLIVFTTLSLFTVCLRVYTRICLVKNFGADDYLMVASLLGAIAFLIVVFVQIQFGLGRQVSFEEVPSFLEALWGTIPLYNIALICCKLSIVLQYYRVFRTPGIQRLLKALFAFLVVYGLWAVFQTIFTCYPVKKYWEPDMEEGNCLDRNVITYINSGVNIASDLVILVIPIPLLKNLQLPLKQKLILVAVFACGAVAVAMSIIRLKALYEITQSPPASQSVQGVSIAIWSCIEINVGIICACVPALKALAVRVFPKFVLSNLYSRSKQLRYGRYNQQKSDPEASQGGNSSSTGGGGVDGNGALENGATVERKNRSSQIRVEQSIEMNEVPVQSVTTSDRDAISQDGSEKGLVMSSSSGWKAECYSNRGKVRTTEV